MEAGGPVRFGLIGAGSWGQAYLRTLALLQDRCRLTHVATSRPAAAASYPHPVHVTPDWRALIRAGCDAVIIASPPDAHAEMVQACLEARIPCIVEKPFCLDPEEAERLARRIDEAGLPVLVDHTRLFHPAYQTLKQMLAEAGEPIRFLLTECMSFGPFRSDVSAWWDWGPHDVSLCLDLMGARPEHMEALAGPEGAGGQPDMVSARLDFAHGVSAWVHVGRLSPKKRRTLTVGTETRLYRLNELSPEPLKTARRLPRESRVGVEWQAVPAGPDIPPLTAMLIYFMDGLAGQDRRWFGASLARDVVQILADGQRALDRARGAAQAGERR